MTRVRLRAREKAVVAVSLVVLGVVTWQVAAGNVLVRFDHHVYMSWGASTWWPVEAVTELGSAPLSGVVLVLAAVHGAFSAGRWWPVLLAAGTSLAMTLVVLALKTATARTGPGLTELDGYPGYFPSGHTATAAVCFGTAAYITVVLRRRRPPRSRNPVLRGDPADLGLASGLGVGTLVGAMTVVTGNHWVSDVVGALAVSAIVLTLGFAAVRAFANRSAPARPG